MFSAVRGKSVAVALSGGVDSLCAMLLLKDRGYHVFGLHGRFIDEADFDIQKLRDICVSLAVELHIADLRHVFTERLLKPFVEAWIEGKTPNPCSLCNRAIKFGALREYAFKLGVDFFATGHYARSFLHPIYALQVLGPARDLKKDQSYFLSLVPAKNLDRLIFPLAGLGKKECREIVQAAGLTPPAVRESQDICFLGNGQSPADFVEGWAQSHFLPMAAPGPIYILEKNAAGKRQIKPAGRHKGLWRYTTGQRRGIGVPYSEPLYVMSREMESASLLLAPRSALALKSAEVGSLNFFVPREKWPEKLYSRLRFRQKPVPVRVFSGKARLQLEFSEPQFPGAEGQVATVEDAEGVILCAGLIEKMSYWN